MIKWIKSFLNSNESIESKAFNVILFVGLTVSIISAVTTYFEGIGLLATMSTLMCGVLVLIVMFTNYVLKLEYLSKVMLCYVINCFMMPVTFFACGGIDSGMPLYMICGLFIIAPLLTGRARGICFAISMVVHLGSIMLSYNYMAGAKPWFQYHTNILTTLDLKGRIVDVMASFLLVGLFLFSALVMMLKAYVKQRDIREELLAKLDDLSKKDELTKLYNRRELFNQLEDADLFKEPDYTVVMMDIDHFKVLNDTYGHLFGDEVLREVAGVLGAAVNEEVGEIAARYGGEEFALILRGSTLQEASKRVDEVRVKIGELRWEELPDVRVTISGGVVPAYGYENVTVLMSAADELLYDAKEAGRNRVFVMQGGL